MNINKTGYRTGEKALTRKEYEKLKAVINDIEDELMIKLAVALGIRRNDIGHGTITRYRKIDGKVVKIKMITGIRIGDVDLKEGNITYYESKKDRNRTIPVSNELCLLIEKVLKSRGKDQSKFLIKYSGRTAYNRFNMYCDKAGIPRRPFHSLRASTVKFCQAAGWSPEAVSMLIGDSMAVIQNHYSVPSFSEMQETVKEKTFI